MHRSEAVIDLAAIAANVGSSEVQHRRRGDGGGQGRRLRARAGALRAGSGGRRRELARGGDAGGGAGAARRPVSTERVLAWLWTPHETEALRAALAADVDISVSSVAGLELVVATAAELGSTARVHLKIDTGLSRNGSTLADWSALLDGRRPGRGRRGDRGRPASGATSSTPTSRATPPPPGRSSGSARRCRSPRRAGVVPEVRHLANSAATVTLPQAHFDLVRPGVAVYGLNPVPDAARADDFGLVPAMTLRSELANVKRVPAGEGVSYGHAYVLERDSTLGAGAARLRRRGAALGDQPGTGGDPGPPLHDQRPGLHGPVRGRPGR